MQDAEMIMAVMENMAQIYKETTKDAFNSFKEQPGEIFPMNIKMNYIGFLVKKNAILFKVYSEKLVACIMLMKEQMFIAKFMGMKPTPHYMENWPQTLNKNLKIGLEPSDHSRPV